MCSENNETVVSVNWDPKIEIAAHLNVKCVQDKAKVMDNRTSSQSCNYHTDGKYV